MVEELDDNNFEKFISEASVPVLVEFGAPWCVHCNKMLPILTDMSDKHMDKVKICKVNTDVSPVMVGKYIIRSLPTFISFKDGNQYKKAIGAQGEEELLSLIE